MRVSSLLACLACATAKSILLSGGDIVAFDSEAESFKVIRNGSVLVTGSRIEALYHTVMPEILPDDTTVIDTTGQIITPGFISTHHHHWQTALKTLGSNTTLAQYIERYGEFQSGSIYTAHDVYYGQAASIIEALNGGTTTTIDHASHTWSSHTSWAGFNATLIGGGRVFWSYALRDVPGLNWTIDDQIPNFREIYESGLADGTTTEIAVAYDFFWDESMNTTAVLGLLEEYDLPLLTAHFVAGPWRSAPNHPTLLHREFDVLNQSYPVVLSHASFLTAEDLRLLRLTNQYVSITPESEMHFGHGQSNLELTLDQAALGVDTHWCFSSDILTQSRFWLQNVRGRHYTNVLADHWSIPSASPMTAYQAFFLATRAGGLSLRRPDLGILEAGALADIVVWNARDSPSLLGYSDPIAAVILHASIGDVLHVMVDGKFVKQDGVILNQEYDHIRAEFKKSVDRIQASFADLPYPTLEGTWNLSGAPFEEPYLVDTQRGDGLGHGQQFLRAENEQWA